MNHVVSPSKKSRTGASERWRQAAVIAAIAGLSLGLFAAREIKVVQSPTNSPIMPSDDEIYTGSILFVPRDEKICRQFLFDNRTGRLTNNGLVDCERAYQRDLSGRAMRWSAERAKVVSEGFRR